MAKRSCAVPGCERPSHARGWCTSHYQRWRHDGNLHEDRPVTRRVAAPLAPCSIEGCEKPVWSQIRQLCSAHNARYLRYGDPTFSPIAPARERFWASVSKGSATDCWTWTGYVNKTGKHSYGRLNVNGKAVLAHVYSYELRHGAVPEGLELDHLCRNTRCVNPDHLDAVTHRENMMRGISIQAINARKTHCKHGHPFSGDNLVVLVSGGRKRRRCRTCDRAKNLAYKKRKKA